MQTRLSVERVRLGCELPDGLALDGYPEVLQQVLEQLLENACLHAFRNNSGGHIQVGARRINGTRLALEVRDNGAGMPPADAARALEPFFTTSFGQGGSGLGLFVAHSLVSGMLGGLLHLDSRPGEGTAVTLDLPLHDDAALALAA